MNKKVLALIPILLTVTAVMAAKSADNLAGAVKVPWHLSSAVMPVPPYGTQDIIGSDTASKLIVNQPNGNTQVMLNGIMGGLNPETTYTVYISNGYTPAVFTGWDVSGNWVLTYSGGYDHAYSLTQVTDGTITGTGVYPSTGTTLIYEKITGSVVGTTVTLNLVYYSDSARTIPTGYTLTTVSTIQSDGTISGGGWTTTSGQAAATYSGSTGWPGFFDTVPAFTFTTNVQGKANWHVNLNKVNLTGLSGSYPMSVWINGGGATILISDSFPIVV